MIKYQYNDGGRKAAGYKGQARDCVCRAIVIATGLDYKEVYKYLAQLHYERFGTKTARNGTDNQDTLKAMKHFGFEKVSLIDRLKPTYTQAFGEFGNCVVKTTRHVAAIKDGALQDTFDGRTYEWEGETKERKAMSIWVKK